MENKEPSPCLTCGHKPKVASFLPDRHAAYCHNPKCPVWHRTKYHFTRAEAIAAWNKRHVCDDHKFCCNTCDHKCGLELLTDKENTK